MCVGPLRRMCHWGPLTALAIIKAVTVMTIHCIYLLWPGLLSSPLGTLHMVMFSLMSGATLYHFLNALIVGPGTVPAKWRPKEPNPEELLQYCTFCEGYKAPRAHHCRKCNCCVLKMDHHCPWINACVGHSNHGYFTYFLLFAVIGCFHGACIMAYTVYLMFTAVYYRWSYAVQPVQMSIYPLLGTLFSLGLAIGVVLAVGMLFVYQTLSICRNQTGVEDWILEKARHRRRYAFQRAWTELMERRDQGDDVTEEEAALKPEAFHNPYDLGGWRNWCMVMSPRATQGDGITWPVRHGCGQYTLTVEQLQQKAEKRARMKEYVIIDHYSGSWVPISKGWRVVCHPPCTDETRITLSKGDTVVVSRWRKYWLYGEKRCRSPVASRATDRLRGWFPRRCAIEEVGATRQQRKSQ